MESFWVSISFWGQGGREGGKEGGREGDVIELIFRVMLQQQQQQQQMASVSSEEWNKQKQ